MVLFHDLVSNLSFFLLPLLVSVMSVFLFWDPCHVFVLCLILFWELKLHLVSFFKLQLASVDIFTVYLISNMNPAVQLLWLSQGVCSLECYVEDFCGLCYLVGFNEKAFKNLFVLVWMNQSHLGCLEGQTAGIWLNTSTMQFCNSVNSVKSIYCGNCGWGAPQSRSANHSQQAMAWATLRHACRVWVSSHHACQAW